MWLKEIELINVGKHRHLQLELQKGLVGVYGPNGSGKSTILDAVAVAVTASWNRMGTKEDNICLLAGPGAESSIRMKLEHMGTELEVFRGLRPAKQWLKVGKKTWTRAPEIQLELEQRLGTAFKLLLSHVFVAQWESAAFLSQTPGERAAAFQLLCRTEKAKQICDEIEKLLKTDTDLTAVIVDDSDTIRQQLAVDEQRQAQHEELAAMARKGMLPTDKVARAQQLQQMRQDHTRLSNELIEIERAIVTRRGYAEQAKVHKDKADEATDEYKQEVARLKPLAEQARLSLHQWQQYEQRQKSRQLVQRLLKTLEREAEEHGPRPEPHPQAEQEMDLKAERHNLVDKQTKYQETLATFEAEGVVECPTCGTPVTDLDAHLQAIRDELPAIQQRIEELDAITGEIFSCGFAVKAWDKWHVEHARSKAEAEARLAAYTELPAVKGNLASFQKVIADLESAERTLSAARTQASTANEALVRHQTALLESEQRASQLRDQIAKCVVDDALLARATAALGRHEQCRQQLAVAEAQARDAAVAVREDQAKLERLQARLARGAKGRKFAARLEQLAADVFHRQKLPRAVAFSNLQDLEADINKGLEDFGSPFWIEAAEDLSFIAHLPGMPPHSADRLSGGQKAVLAIAFRTAMSSLFDADLDLLCLDEPGAGLDSVNVQFLASALSSYAAKIRDRRQVLLVSHAPELINSFDQVVDLGALNGN